MDGPQDSKEPAVPSGWDQLQLRKDWEFLLALT